MTTTRITDSSDNTTDVDVVIVGLGPTGATAANLLGQRGIRTAVIERDLTVFPRQRAIASDEDAHRVWQGLGLFDEMLTTMSTDVRIHLKHGNRTFLSMTSTDSFDQGVPGMAFYHQPELERVLREGIARFSTVSILSGVEAVALTQDSESATLTLRPVDGGPDRQITSKFVIAADGGSSSVRKMLGIALPGKHIQEQWFDIQLRAWYDLPVGAPLDFTFISDPERPGVDCPCPMGYHRVEFRVNKGETVEQLQTEDGLRGLLAERGIDYDKVEVFRSWGYTFHIRQAETWSRGRVFLAGDAAHIMPPFAGQGVSSGVRDAANLCWKIDAVLTAGADPDLLRSYEAERRPNVVALTRFSLGIGRMVMLRNNSAASVRDGLVAGAAKVPGVSPWLRGMGLKPRYTLGTKGGYFGGTERRRSPRGSFVKQPWVVGSDLTPILLDTILGNNWTWVGFPSSPIPPMLADAGVGEVKLHSASDLATHSVPSGHYVDSEGVLEKQMRKARANAFLVRPDRFIFASDREMTEEDYRRVTDVVVSGVRSVRCRLGDSA
ncbi:3-(3-hydroxy-phenyl)propionate/3-hydroxycinnamic acid hydroxylase [Rhodococcoides trifolii]|uniref:3-(3-hydroxy-phenyl)propionate/3-hydroxycinnamic acid hydroxylase n=1 Tax=Rhodococcoides trifolii TaxID=908250 RepID=A0A917LHM9_9NOCA|nr:FAD-dependent monooxygenase [Rhodococcus trifolii]GGG24525.1 3-(3-hydroxy-phenyl)propionate/3-hydroxycinnamic acid hydroxylase [Rhodococcus trifolii]